MMIKEEISKLTTYLIKFHKILSIKFPIDLWFKCSLHLIKFVPSNIFEPRMSLIKIKINQYNKKGKKNNVQVVLIWKENTLIWSVPSVPSLCSTSQSNLLIRSFASGDSLASSGNSKWFFQFTIWHTAIRKSSNW